MIHSHSTPARRPRPRLRQVAALAVAVLGLAALATPAQARAEGEHPDANAFVQRDGTHLTLDGRQFRFSGPNMYWLGLDENVGGVDPATRGVVGYPSYFRIRDGLVTAKAMGATVVRSHTLGVSTGNPDSVEPSLGTFNENAFAPIDYAVAEAGRLGLRLVIPLTDNWQYYSGSRFDFLRWLGLSTANDGALFYTDPHARAAYQQFVRTVLLHRNPLTGKRLVDDPTIMAWELGNELNGATPDWVQANASFIKSLAPHQLVAAGKQSGVDPAVLSASAVDISDSHYYPPTSSQISADAHTVTAAGKVYMAGEFDSNAANDSLLSAVAKDPDVSGATFWSLFPDADHYGYVQHSDGFTVHFPGDTPAMRSNVAALTRFASAMSGRPAPGVVGDAPLITAIGKDEGLNTVAWRNTAGAFGYLVQRRDGDGSWRTVSGATPLSGSSAPWLDPTPATGTTGYRVLAVDAAGAVVRSSRPVEVSATGQVTVDPLEDWYVASAHSADLRRTPTASGVQVAPPRGMTGSVTYLAKGLTAATFLVRSPARPRPAVQVTTDGSTWRETRAVVTPRGDGSWAVEVRGGRGDAGVRLAWRRGDVFGLTGASISDVAASVPTSAPAAFAVTSPVDGQTGVSTISPIAWQSAGRAAYYTLTVSTHSDLSSPLVSATGITGTSYAPTQAWPGDTTLYVRVTAVNGIGTTSASANFTTRTAPAGVLVDDFDTYPDDAALQAAWKPNSGGDPITATLGPAGVGTGHSLVLDYTAGPNGYNGVIHNLPTAQDWNGTTGLQFWVEPGADGQQLNVQFTANGAFWEKKITLAGTAGREVTIPWADFAPPPWAPQGATLDLSTVTAVALYPATYPVAQGGQDTIRIDSILAAK
ncbi:MAG TPA: carbohydrate binding domain-containing protein [Propionibacteriaceae bacterium]|nr:carbohydrate binding domain-containing protein [Propionibacteriaceae bacterium]